MPRTARGYFDFRGGLNTDTAPDNLADNELSEAVNAVLDQRGSVAKRQGFARLNATSYGAQVEQLLLFPKKDGTRQILAVIGTTLARISETDGSKTDIQALAGSRVGYAVYRDYLYFVDGADYRKYDGTSVKPMQPAAPSSAPTVTATGSNSPLQAGTYRCVVCFIDADGTESPPSPEATVSIQTQGQKIEWTVPVGPPGTYGRRLYRTQENGAIFKLVKEIEDNTTTTFVDDKANFELGVELTKDNDLAPIKRCKLLVWHPKSFRFFAAGDVQDQGALYFSEPGRPDYWKATSRVYPATNEGPVKALLVFGEALLVIYERGVYRWAGVDPLKDAVWEKVPVPDGTVASRSVVSTPSSVTYLARGGLYAIGPSVAGQSIALTETQELAFNLSRNKVSSLIRGMVHPETAAAVYDADYERYLLAHGDDPTDPRNNKILVYHWPLGAFTVWDGVQVNDWLWVESGKLYAATDGYILKANTGYNDAGQPITLWVSTKQLHLGYPIHSKRLFNLYIAARQHAAAGVPIKITVQGDWRSVQINDIAVEDAFFWGREWGLVWGFTDYVVRRARVRLKGLRFRVTVEDSTLDQPMTLYGLGFDFRSLRQRVEMAGGESGGQAD